jgi:hypothetical protein
VDLVRECQRCLAQVRFRSLKPVFACVLVKP